MKLMSRSPILIFFVCLTSVYAQSMRRPTSRAAGQQNIRVKERLQLTKKSELKRPILWDDEAYAREKDGVLAAKRRQLIADITRFLSQATDDAQRSELQIRLGGLYMEEYYRRLAMAHERYAQAAETFRSQRKRGAPPRLDLSAALPLLDKAASIFRALIQKHPTHPRRQEILYSLAIASIDRGNITGGIALLEDSTRAGSQPKLLNQALIQLGDHYFDKNDFARAELYYSRVISAGYQPLLTYAVFRRSWCAYHSGRSAFALSSLKWIVSYEARHSKETGVHVANEALRDLPLLFTDLKETDSAFNYFRNLNEPARHRAVETMASLYAEKADYPRAIRLWESLLALEPNYERNAAYLLGIVNATDLGGNPTAAMKLLGAKLTMFLGPSKWNDENRSHKEAFAETESSLEEATRKYALRFHGEAQQLHHEPSYTIAAQLYEEYLRWFADSAKAPTMRFNLAEIRFRRGELVAAADLYFETFKAKEAASLRQPAILAAVLALDKQLGNERKKAGLAPVSTKNTAKLTEKEAEEKEPFNGTEEKFVRIAEAFLDAYPNGKEAPDVQYEVAYLHYIHGDLAKGEKLFKTLVERHPGHPMAYAAASLRLDILNRTTDITELIRACREYLANKQMPLPIFQRETKDILRKSELRNVATLEAKGSFKEAAQGYLGYANHYGAEDRNLNEKALYNASICFTKADEPFLAATTAERFLLENPKSGLRREMLELASRAFANLGNQSKAAGYYEKLAREYPGHPDAKAALRLASLLYWGGNNSTRAEEILQELMHRNPSERAAWERDLILMLESQKLTQRELAYYQGARNRANNSAGERLYYTLRIAELLAKRSRTAADKELRVARRLASGIHSVASESSRAIEAVAQLRYQDARGQEAAFRRIRLNVANDDLASRFEQKLARLKTLQSSYQRVAALGNAEYALASMYRTAFLNHELAEEAKNAPVPTGLPAQQLETYRSEVEARLVTPFRDSALSVAKACVKKAEDLGIFSRWTARCYALTALLAPERHPPVNTLYVPSLLTTLIIPEEKTKTRSGNLKACAYPCWSSALFVPLSKETQSAAPETPALKEVGETTFEMGMLLPTSINFSSLATDRTELIRGWLEKEKPGDAAEAPSFSYLNSLRSVDPKAGVREIRRSLESDPSNLALNNLLGLALLDLGEVRSAHSHWLALVASGTRHAGIWNNLGVTSLKLGREREAIEYFQESLLQDSPLEASINLGLLALKYRNPTEALKHLERALKLDSDMTITKTAFAVALLQKGETLEAKERLLKLVQERPEDPYVRISLAYIMLDLEHDPEKARQLLSEYVQHHPIEIAAFERALQDASRTLLPAGPLVNNEPL